MKIEKVNDHQIRCTLTKADLADRELKISELAYGTEKAKNLFRDMMQQASLKFGFETEDIPLMIEAIPLNADCIVLIITKVEDPEELDTRFSKFAPSVHEGDEEDDDSDDLMDNISSAADDVLDLFKHMKQNIEKKEDSADKTDTNDGVTSAAPVQKERQKVTKIFSFSSLYEIMRPAGLLQSIYDGDNSLYKNAQSGKYLLVINKSADAPEAFNKVCNILSEYGRLEKNAAASECYMSEHYELIIGSKAIQSLAF